MFTKENFNYKVTVDYRIINNGKVSFDNWEIFSNLDDCLAWANGLPEEDGYYKDIHILAELSDF